MTYRIQHYPDNDGNQWFLMENEVTLEDFPSEQEAVAYAFSMLERLGKRCDDARDALAQAQERVNREEARYLSLKDALRDK